MVELTKKKTCSYCHHADTPVRLVRIITSSGVSQVFWLCPICNHNADGIGLKLPHEPIKKFGINIDDIPIFQDNRSYKCEVCGDVGVEWHHWAPRHLFDDADNWPMGWLCRKHHTLWHSIVTPDMCNKRRQK